MKKVCILSMQKVDNFGSLLQSYSLKKILESLKCDVSFIDIIPNKDDDQLLDVKMDFSKETSSNKKFLKRIDKYFLYRMKNKFLNKKQNKVFEQFRENSLGINDDDNCKEYDICVIGSDEVFNCSTKAPWGFTTQLFGNVKNAQKIITYAASCGATQVKNINKKTSNAIIRSFKNISAFSVRDDNTKKFVEKFSDKDINMNLDPVLVGNFDSEIEHSNRHMLKRKYCIVYSYYNRIKSTEEIDTIKEFCKKNDMLIVSVGAPQFWINKFLVLNPFEMLNVFKNAEFVITDTFHGTIFASKYSKKFMTILRESNTNKLEDLINRINKSNHLCKDIKDIYTIYNQDNNLTETKNITEKEREASIKYLMDNIK